MYNSTPFEYNGYEFALSYAGMDDGIIFDPTEVDLDDPRFLEALKRAKAAFDVWRRIITLDLNKRQNAYNDITFNQRQALIEEIASLLSQTDLPLNPATRRDLENFTVPKPRYIKPSKKPAPGYVYLIRADNGIYKIGRTAVPDNRIRTFEVKLPFDVEYVCLIETDDMHQLEATLHQRFADKRGRGEWFALDDSDVEYIKSLAVQS